MRTCKHTIISAAIACIGTISTCFAQPFLDVVNVHYISSPDQSVIKQKKNATRLKNLSIQATIPLQFKNKLDAIIISPSFEMWSTEVNDIHEEFERQYSVALPVTYLKTLSNPDWSILSTIIIRRNGYEVGRSDNWQVGGAVIANFKANENLRYKLGVYANREFFGLFVMPLLGIDWEISKKTNLFGILPGSLTLEHKLSQNLYTGASFRAITNSYRTPSGYWRINENRLGAFLDYYFSKRIVINFEGGHSILRKLSAGDNDKSEVNWEARDNLYFKLGAAFRFRFR